MKQKSITFRCSAAQHERLENAMQALAIESRTAFISSALEDFLTYVEQKDISELDLFQLVEQIDSTGSSKSFAAQA